LGGPGFESRHAVKTLCSTKRARFTLGPTQPPVQWTPGYFNGVKWAGREVDHLQKSSAGFKSEWSYISTPPIRLHGVDRDNLNFSLCSYTGLLYQYSETNVMHFLFSLLRINGLCMFRALLVHPKETLHKRHLVYCVRVMSVGCTRIEVELQDLRSPRTTSLNTTRPFTIFYRLLLN
jgi:hypothetical protein